LGLGNITDPTGAAMRISHIAHASQREKQIGLS
jgi:hypothetical protein